MKIFLIWMAEKMNLSASNKLLKLFEEPPKNTVFILICENEGRLLPTITSRCQKVYINNKLCEIPGTNVSYKDKILVCGKIIKLESKIKLCKLYDLHGQRKQ